MTWAKLDDKLHSRASTLLAGNEAMGVWVRGESYCADHETDGALPRAVVELISGGKKAMTRVGARLVEAGLWEETPDGYLSVGFLDRNPSKADADAKRAAEAARKQAQRGKRPATLPADVPPGHERDSDARPAICPEDVPPGRSAESRGLSHPCPAPPVPDPVPVPEPIQAGGARAPTPAPPRARTRDPDAVSPPWPSLEHERAAERFLAALQRETGRPPPYRVTALHDLATRHAGAFVAAVDEAERLGVGWQGWHVKQPRNWLETLCRQVAEERTKSRAPPARTSRPIGETYPDDYDGPRVIGVLR